MRLSTKQKRARAKRRAGYKIEWVMEKYRNLRILYFDTDSVVIQKGLNLPRHDLTRLILSLNRYYGKWGGFPPRLSPLA